MQIKNRQQMLTILTLTAVGLLVLDKIVSPPLENLWKTRSAQIEKLRADVKEGDLKRHRKDSLRSRWARIQSGALSNDTTAAEQQLFSGLNRWSEMSGVTLDNVAPSWKPGADAAYKTLECRVDASGSIDVLSQFMYALETDPMALKVQSVEMTSKNNNGTVIGMGVQISGLVLTGQEAKK